LYKHISISASCQNSNSKNNITGWTCGSSGDKKFTHKFGEETLSEVATWNTKNVGERKQNKTGITGYIILGSEFDGSGSEMHPMLGFAICSTDFPQLLPRELRCVSVHVYIGAFVIM
jgi:hypothetical protein